MFELGCHGCFDSLNLATIGLFRMKSLSCHELNIVFIAIFMCESSPVSWQQEPTLMVIVTGMWSKMEGKRGR